MANKNNQIMGIPTDKLHTAIRKLESAKSGKYAGTKGVHTVFSGLNAELRRKGVSDVVAFWRQAESAGVVATRGAKGGSIVYMPGEKPASVSKGAADGMLD